MASGYFFTCCFQVSFVSEFEQIYSSTELNVCLYVWLFHLPVAACLKEPWAFVYKILRCKYNDIVQYKA